ncbi:histidine phosphatase family protein [Halomonas sp. NCCP-2165]|nr:histidine phosphatase family protein [Halomonas sp. NCCP-2165]GKW49940.1 phosphoglycerate mutase [Halomonas sp. NCCP-2165]
MLSPSLTLVVVRHGLTAWNRSGRYQGHRDIPLDLEAARPGLERLRAWSGKHLQGLDAIHCSDLTRCRQTLAHLAPPGVPPHPAPRFDARLRELNFGAYEGKCYAELESDPDYRAWIDGRGERPPPGGESAGELRARLDAWFHALTLEAGAKGDGAYRALVVTHGGVLRELRRRFEAIDFWAAGVTQAEGRHFHLIRHGDAWRCEWSSAVPTPASAPR